jgi:hypothetical protein
MFWNSGHVLAEILGAVYIYLYINKYSFDLSARGKIISMIVTRKPRKSPWQPFYPTGRELSVNYSG